MSGQTPGQVPELFVTWYRIGSPTASDALVESSWDVSMPTDQKFWTDLQAAIAAAAPAAPGSPLLRDVLGSFEYDYTGFYTSKVRANVFARWRDRAFPAAPAAQPAPDVADDLREGRQFAAGVLRTSAELAAVQGRLRETAAAMHAEADNARGHVAEPLHRWADALDELAKPPAAPARHVSTTVTVTGERL